MKIDEEKKWSKTGSEKRLKFKGNITTKFIEYKYKGTGTSSKWKTKWETSWTWKIIWEVTTYIKNI